MGGNIFSFNSISPVRWTVFHQDQRKSILFYVVKGKKRRRVYRVRSRNGAHEGGKGRELTRQRKGGGGLMN